MKKQVLSFDLSQEKICLFEINPDDVTTEILKTKGSNIFLL